MTTDIQKSKTDTWTREELLSMRGYPPDVIAGSNGNGHSPAPVEPELVPRACEQCGDPVETEGHRFCSLSCRCRANGAKSAKAARGPSLPRELPEPPGLGNGASVPLSAKAGHDVTPMGDIGAVLARLCADGVAIELAQLRCSDGTRMEVRVL